MHVLLQRLFWHCWQCELATDKQTASITHSGDVIVAGLKFISGEEFSFIMYLVAWCNTLVLACYSCADIDGNLPVLDAFIAIFPCINALHLVAEMVLAGGTHASLPRQPLPPARCMSDDPLPLSFPHHQKTSDRLNASLHRAIALSGHP